PRADGHCLVIPKTPCRNLLDASVEQLQAVIATTQRMGHAVMKAFDAQGVTIQQFNEAAGGQEVFHLHFHVLPRHEGEKLRPPGKMEDMDVIAQNAEKLRGALAEG
ncbi:MAG: HIT family protein, partial [Paracoccaceae bacterium]